jgi:hypothetical protein
MAALALPWLAVAASACKPPAASYSSVKADDDAAAAIDCKSDMREPLTAASITD